MPDVILINPPSGRHGALMEHLGLGYLAAGLRLSNFTVEIIDAPSGRLTFDDLTSELRSRNFSVLGVSVLFQESLRTCLDWLRSLRDGGLKAHVTIGAHPATFTYDEILKQYGCVDSVVRGEGEITIVELTTNIINGEDWRSVDGIAWRDGDEIVVNPSRPLVEDLNTLPWPARDVLAARPNVYEQLVASASRGCPRSCSFCSIAAFYRSFKGCVWRHRWLEDVFDEIDAARLIAPFKHVLLVDDTFIGPGKIGREQAFEFAETLARRRKDYLLGSSCRADQIDEGLFRELKKAGLGFVFLGIESGNQETLDLFNKKSTVEINRKALAVLDKLEIPVEIGFIMFNPYTSFLHIRSDLDFLLQTGCGPDVRHLSNLGIFPGQPLVEKLRKDNLLQGSPLDYHYRFLDKSVGDFFEAIRTQLLNEQSAFIALRRLGQLVQANLLGETTLDAEDRSTAEMLITEFHRAFYDLLTDTSKLFESGVVGLDELTKLKSTFTGRCQLLTGKADRLTSRLHTLSAQT